MTCPHCHGFIWPYEDDVGPRCMNCGRSPEPLPIRKQLLAAGIYATNAKSTESEVYRRRGVEAQPGNGDSHVLQRFPSR